MPFEQDNMRIKLVAEFDTDVALVNKVEVVEQVSGLFKIEAEIVMPEEPLDFKEILGQPVTIEYGDEASDLREYSGILSRAIDLPSNDGGVRHRLEIVPWLWLLTLKSNCRIFQEKSIPEIVEEVLAEHTVADFELRGLGQYEPLLYCVQYQESDFDFVSRLLEQAGIFYFFEHADGKHRMVMVDSIDPLVDAEMRSAELLYRPMATIDVIDPHISSFQFDQALRPGGHALNDFHFLDPSTSMLTDIQSGLEMSVVKDLEIYDYPGGYVKVGAEDAAKLGLGDKEVLLRKEESDARSIQVAGESDVCQLQPGNCFTLVEHTHDDYNIRYIVLSVKHKATNVDSIVRDGDSSGPMSSYENSFTCVPDTVVYRPPRTTLRPRVLGPQTAIVVGPAGEEIYIDKHGRVKVQFHWDRVGQLDETSSCWIRVSQNWAGKNWGAFFHPRIGQEVIVDFLEGDPDRPIITGRVYNAEQPLPYPTATQAGVKSHSSLGGAVDNCNEIQFEDKKGSEEFYLKAERNQKILVNHDKAESIGNDEVCVVGNNQDLEVRRDRSANIAGDEDVSIGEDRTLKVGGNEDRTIGSKQTIDVGSEQTVTLGSKRSLSISDDDTQSVGGKRTTSIGTDESLSVGDKLSIDSGSDTAIKVGKSLTIEAGDQITIKVGKVKFTLKKDGTVKIEGKNVELKGSGKIKVQASQDLVLKGSKVQSN